MRTWPQLCHAQHHGGTGSDATWAEGDGDPYSDGTGGLGGDAGNGGAVTLTFSSDTEPAAAYLLDSTRWHGRGRRLRRAGLPDRCPPVPPEPTETMA
jgi:hypothetical protein